MKDALVQQVAEIITRYSMFGHAARVGVAVSGGADSVALLRILHQLAFEWDWHLVVLHVNHGLRGQESEADEEFVRDLANSLQLPVVVARRVPRCAATAEAGNLEEQARELRKAFFTECRQTHALNAIALGHTRSDQAETVLHRILRGSGLTGLAAMRYLTESGVGRPLLGISRTDVRDWLREQDFGWRNDSSNDHLRFTRNRLRLQTLPQLSRDYNPQLEATLASMAEVAQAEEEYWAEKTEELAARLARRHRHGLTVDVIELAALPAAVQRRLVRRLLGTIRQEVLRGLDARHIREVLALCNSTEGHDRVVIPGADALRSFSTLLLTEAGRLTAEARDYRLSLLAGEETELPFGAGYIRLEQVPPAGRFRDNVENVQQLGVERVRLGCEGLGSQPLWVRNWQPGDQLHRPGHSRPEKVKQLFQEFRVRLWERRHWPVVLSGESIIWVRGFGIVAGLVSHEASAPLECELVYRPVE